MQKMMLKNLRWVVMKIYGRKILYHNQSRLNAQIKYFLEITDKRKMISNQLTDVYLFAFYPFQISWIRHKDSALLAVNNYIYSSSHRIKVFHENRSSEWKLSINPVEVSDDGIYECQIATTPTTFHSMAVSVIGEFTHTHCKNFRVNTKIYYIRL